MKKKVLLAVFSVLFCVSAAFAQAPYKHSIGGTIGSMQAFSYKTFVTDHFAIQVDLGTKITHTDGENARGINIWDLELNPNFMYEGNFVAGLYGFAGGGVSLGYSWTAWDPRVHSTHPIYYWHYNEHYWDCGKFGINAILGLEYKLNIPLTLQLDFRPGYGMLFGEKFWGDNVWNYFDWSLNAGIRYAF
jgi:hypothetical protein